MCNLTSFSTMGTLLVETCDFSKHELAVNLEFLTSNIGSSFASSPIYFTVKPCKQNWAMYTLYAIENWILIPANYWIIRHRRSSGGKPKKTIMSVVLSRISMHYISNSNSIKRYIVKEKSKKYFTMLGGC